ncbi:PspA/IM30 family protein [Paenibacillus sp. M1]|uniref:PspA/IM30 family protein n=1 Tax=Paenibacillus haidiansis TaxID=1574488 RepID=A0ABU7VPM9_9BACL
MGIFARMKDIAAADAHRLLDQVEDPVSMAKHYIRQLEEQIDHTRSALKAQIAAKQQYDALVARTGQVIDKRARQAELAVERNRDDIASLAIQEKLHHAKLQQTYMEQREAVQEQAEALGKEMERLRDLHKELSDKLGFLLAHSNAAAALRAAKAYAPSGDAGRISRGFDRMEEKIMRLETGALAYRSPDPVSDRLTGWSEQEEVQAELAKLKADKQTL